MDRLCRFHRVPDLATGVVMVAVGVLLFTGQFTVLSSFLAGFGQFVNVDL